MLIVFEVNFKLPIIRLLLIFGRGEELHDFILGEQGTAQDPHDLHDWATKLKVVLNDSDETVCDDGDMNLNTYGIVTLSPKGLDPEVLLDPFEQLHLPSIFIKESNVLGCKVEVVRIVSKRSVQVRGIVDNPSDDSGILLLILLLGKAYALVFEDVVSPIKYAFSIDNLIGRFTLLPDDEESPEHVDAIESGEVKIASVKHIARQRLVCEPVHRVDIMHLGIGNPIEHGYLSNDVNLSMDSDARLGASELSPSEYGHAQVNGRGVNGIESAMQFKLLRDTSGLGNSHHIESELLKDAMVSEGVGLRQHLSVDRLVAKSEVFRLLGMGGCYICEFSKASTAHKLTEHQNQQMVPMRHRPALGPVVVLGDNAPELPLREELYYLCKNVLSEMHICPNFDLGAKVRISKVRQGFLNLLCCA